MSKPVTIGQLLPGLLRSLADEVDSSIQPGRQAGAMGTGDERGSASEPAGARPAASEALRASEDTSSPERGPIEAGASEALRASERRPDPAVGSVRTSPLGGFEIDEARNRIAAWLHRKGCFASVSQIGQALRLDESTVRLALVQLSGQCERYLARGGEVVVITNFVEVAY